ncbi:4'-phosphopantetheinyl transferase superfamily protein [Paenibacillus sp. Marseille-Q4541]|uniref:4'-phosphopantetheinyl transferase family protein n=1 Tax=Paenibacillus sp. Marseille-Q4541 TaxID=2831522 RepID=UPI001BAC5BF3|nr:4'-phosphopantetheinyl transferase superfamily protein [Paenibacillus sp. Marseille-Q4541]
MDIWSVHLRPILDCNEDWMRVIPLMSPELQTKIYKFRKPDDRLRTLCGELLLQLYASERWGIDRTDLVKKYNPYGKPELAKYPAYHYNISHSGDWVVSAFDNNLVGVDIEKIAPIEMSIAERFFSPSEVNLLWNQKEEQRQSFFYDLWTLKESYIKAEGAGLSIPLNSFSFEFQEHNKVDFYRSGEADSSWYFHQYTIDPGYALSVCGREPVFPKQVKAMSWDTLIQVIQQV